MSNIKFVFASGNWIRADKKPESDANKYYIVTLHQTEMGFDRIPDNYWRYNNNRWEWYTDGEWTAKFNPLYEVIAYMEIINVEPYREENENE